MPPATTRRPLPATVSRATAAAVAATALLTGCTAHMSMTVGADGTFDAVVEMRDTTGAVFDADPDCSPYTSASALGLGPQEAGSATVQAEELTGDDGSGCRVTITGVQVVNADDVQEGRDPLVVRDGDRVTVTLPPLLADAASSSATEAAGAAGATGTTPSPEGAEATPAQAATQGDDSLAGLVDARLTLTFPGAVTDAGGGEVSGTTVTWTDPDVLASGVSATGLATPGAGLSLWDRFSWWVAGGAVTAVAALGTWLATRPRRRARLR